MTRVTSDPVFIDDKSSLPFLWRLIPAALCFLLILGPMVWSIGPLFFHGFYGPDDYLRMVQVAAFLDAPFSSPYYIDRMGPEGLSNFTWTRIADLVPGFCLWLLRPVLGEDMAAYAAATMTPALYLFALLSLVYIYARMLLTKKQAIAALIVVSLTWPMMRQFMPGRVDHHALTLLFFLAGFIFCCASMRSHRVFLYPALAALFLALSVTVAVEVLPWVAFVSALGCLLWVVHGSSVLRMNAIYALSLLLFSVLLFSLQRYPWAAMTAACDTLSPQILMMISGVTVFWMLILCLQAIRRSFFESVSVRLCALVTGGMAVSFMVYKLAGHCFFDPYAIQDPLVKKIWLDGVQEAHPWYKLWGEYSQMAAQSAVPFLLGTMASIWAWRTDQENKTIWGGLTMLLVAGFLLMNVQARFGEFAALLSSVPIVWGGCHAFAALRDYFSARVEFTPARRIGLSAVFFMLCLLFFLSRFYSERISTHAVADQSAKCSTHMISHILSEQPDGLVAAHVNIGPEILFRTTHRVLAAPYHMNESGIRTVYDIFTAPTDTQALELMRDQNVSYLVLCPAALPYWQRVSQQDDIFAVRLLDGGLPEGLSRIVPLQGQQSFIYKMNQ